MVMPNESNKEELFQCNETRLGDNDRSKQLSFVRILSHKMNGISLNSDMSGSSAHNCE